MLLLLLVLELAVLGSAQKAQNACFTGSGSAVSPISSAFQQCNYLNDTINSCGALNQASQLGCLCKQNVFNAIFDCENEDRECLDNYYLDNRANELKSQWHAACNNYITFEVTTPKLSTLTATTGVRNNQEFCDYAVTECAVLTASVDSCNSAFPFSKQPGKLSSCICEDGILSAASVCEYDFNSTCAGVPAVTKNITFWSLCPAQVSKFVATRVTTTSDLPKSLPPLTAGPGPASSKATAGTATATGTAKNGAISGQIESLKVTWLVVALAVMYGSGYT